MNMDVLVSYDSYNRVVGLSNGVATISYTYDDGDRLIEEVTTFNDQNLPPSLRTASVHVRLPFGWKPGQCSDACSRSLQHQHRAVGVRIQHLYGNLLL